MPIAEKLLSAAALLGVKPERAISMITTRIFEANKAAYTGGKRRALNEGGTSSSKTYSILQLLIQIAMVTTKPLIISVVSESLPHLKRGCIRDFTNIMGRSWDDRRFNHTDFIYNFGLAKIEFFSADEPSKMRGGRRDILFLNEANNIDYETYRELDVRTKHFTFLDWNPVSEFWAHEHGLLSHPENAYIHSTYQDALAVLPHEVVERIEAEKERDPNWWNIYGMGRLGKITGLIYPYFEQCTTLPESGQEFYGLDFGYSTDPTALVHCLLTGDLLYCEELIYEAGMTNDAIAMRMAELGVRKHHAEIFADAAEPKSIAEIHRYGFNIKPCLKGPDSVEYGHQRLRQYTQFWTKASLNAIKEQRNFRYVPDKNGKLTDKTTHNFSHLMDARRYALMGYVHRARVKLWEEDNDNTRLGSYSYVASQTIADSGCGYLTHSRDMGRRPGMGTGELRELLCQKRPGLFGYQAPCRGYLPPCFACLSANWNGRPDRAWT